MFKLTMHFKHEMIGIWQRFHRNFKLSGTFELSMFELTVPDLYIGSRTTSGNDNMRSLFLQTLLKNYIIHCCKRASIMVSLVIRRRQWISKWKLFADPWCDIALDLLPNKSIVLKVMWFMCPFHIAINALELLSEELKKNVTRVNF